MFSGWVRHLRLTAVAKTGVSPAVIVLAIFAGLCALSAIIFAIFAAFIWLANEYTPLTAALVLALFFLLLAILAGICALVAKRNTIQKAKVELATRSSSPLLDPNMLGILLQVGRSVGLRRILPLVAAGFLAAGFAREWMRAPPTDEVDPNSD